MSKSCKIGKKEKLARYLITSTLKWATVAAGLFLSCAAIYGFISTNYKLAKGASIEDVGDLIVPVDAILGFVLFVYILMLIISGIGTFFKSDNSIFCRDFWLEIIKMENM